MGLKNRGYLAGAQPWQPRNAGISESLAVLVSSISAAGTHQDAVPGLLMLLHPSPGAARAWCCPREQGAQAHATH